MCLLRVARNLFSTTTTLNESHCRRENNPQKTARQCLPPAPTLDIPLSAAKSPISLSRSRGNSVRNFVLRPSSSGGRQSPISRSTEIQFKPLITTELSVHCLPYPSLVRPFLSIIISLPPATLSATASIRSAPISATIRALARNGEEGRGCGRLCVVYFSNLKSYLLISYVSPPRLGIFTEAIVSHCSANGSHCSYARACSCARYRFYLVYFFPPSVFSLFLTLSPPPPPPTPSPALVLIFFQSRLMRRAREIVRNERLFHLDVLAIVLVCDSGSNPRHYINIGTHSFESFSSKMAFTWHSWMCRLKVTIYICWFDECRKIWKFFYFLKLHHRFLHSWNFVKAFFSLIFKLFLIFLIICDFIISIIITVVI